MYGKTQLAQLSTHPYDESIGDVMKTATILTIIGLVLSFGAGAALWTHDHSKALPVANKAHNKQSLMLNVYHASIHQFEEHNHDLKMTIAGIEKQLTEIVLSGNKTPEILRLKIQLEIRLKDWQRQLRQKEKRLHDTRMQESQLIDRLHTA